MRDISEVRHLERIVLERWQAGELRENAAEIIRDTLLWVTGEDTLSAEQFAEGYHPENPMESDGNPNVNSTGIAPVLSTE